MLKVLIWQIGVGAVLAAALWSMYGQVAGYSALLGALTCVIPNAFLALRLAVPRRDPGARSLIRAAYLGELGKLAITVLMFGTVFVLVRPLNAAALFAGFVTTQLTAFAGFVLHDKAETTEITDNKNGE